MTGPGPGLGGSARPAPPWGVWVLAALLALRAGGVVVHLVAALWVGVVVLALLGLSLAGAVALAVTSGS